MIARAGMTKSSIGTRNLPKAYNRSGRWRARRDLHRVGKGLWSPVAARLARTPPIELRSDASDGQAFAVRL
jgi:hypothetical protein